jgi:hypothetical protein
MFREKTMEYKQKLLNDVEKQLEYKQKRSRELEQSVIHPPNFLINLQNACWVYPVTQSFSVSRACVAFNSRLIALLITRIQRK